MDFETFKRRKREGRLPRIRIPSNGFARLDGWMLGSIIVIAAMELCRAHGWLQ